LYCTFKENKQKVSKSSHLANTYYTFLIYAPRVKEQQQIKNRTKDFKTKTRSKTAFFALERKTVVLTSMVCIIVYLIGL